MKYLARSGGVVEAEVNGMLSGEEDGSLRSTHMNIGTNIRKRSADGQIFERLDEDAIRTPAKLQLSFNGKLRSPVRDGQEEFGSDEVPMSDRRKALFEPLGPTGFQGGRSGESLLPPPDFESATYPRGWAVGKKRKLVNVDVVESMRRVAVLEMNRKDREIDGLNEQLEEDARCLEHLRLQLHQERSKRADVERENENLRNQISLLMDMVQENEDEESVDVA